jgi:hypothetical protein
MATTPIAINPAEAITGYYSGGGRNHGLLRARAGTITTSPGSEPQLINPAEEITGWQAPRPCQIAGSLG